MTQHLIQLFNLKQKRRANKFFFFFQSARLYTASMLRILLRARIPLLENWAMEMLVNQLYDQSVAVAMEALSVISEACEEEVRETFINQKYNQFLCKFTKRIQYIILHN